MSVPTTSNGQSFDSFYSEVKELETKDAQLTSELQIERLLRKGSTYFNLNPYEVLQIEYAATLEEAKKKYRKLSILIHPDKNPNDRDRAQSTFDIINKAYKQLEDTMESARTKLVLEEATARLEMELKEKRKRLKKAGLKEVIEEDNPIQYKKSYHVHVMKLFADRERKRKMMEDRDQNERKRQREAEIDDEDQAKTSKEWNKNFEETRDARTSSWRDFQTKGKNKSKLFKVKKESTDKKYKTRRNFDEDIRF